MEKITQAILAKAFRGELVPTEAELARQEGRDYEPASALLERIRAEREAWATVSPSRSRRRSPRKARATEATRCRNFTRPKVSVLNIPISDFEFVSYFVLRISCFRSRLWLLPQAILPRAFLAEPTGEAGAVRQ